MRKHKNERKHKHWTDILWDLALLLGLKEEARVFSYESETEEEIDRKRQRERNRSQRERELDMAK